MPDLGHELTERRLQALERRVAKEYATASKEMSQKLQDYLEELEEKRLAKVALLEQGVITEDEYKKWVFRHTMVGKRWKEMSDVLTKDMHNANLIAHKIIRDEMPNVYALNGNYATYQIEHDGRLDTGFTLYNHDTAEYLLKEERELMPGPSAKKEKEIAENKDMQWNKGKIQSSVLQGILQGESPYAVAARLGTVAAMNMNASIRYARTMTTNAQNAGRYQAFRRAKALGVDLTIEWQATLDNRTRHEHRMMHGQRRNVDEPFEVSGVKILWPAQVKYGSSDIPQRLIWNCRCTLLSWVKGFEGETVKTSPKMGEMTFEEWQNANKPKIISRSKKTTNPYGNEMKTKGYVGLSGAESDEFMETYHNKSLIVKNHLNTMQGGQSRRINRALRSGKELTDEKDIKMVERLDKAITKNELPEDMTLFRGVSVSEFRDSGVFEGLRRANVPMDLFKSADGKIDFDAWGKAFEIAQNEELSDLLEKGKKLIGVVVEDKGFMQVSASSQRNIFVFSDINIQLHAPEGLNAYISDYKEESEIILQRGTKYEILGAEISEVVAANGNRKKVLQLIARIVK